MGLAFQVVRKLPSDADAHTDPPVGVLEQTQGLGGVSMAQRVRMASENYARAWGRKYEWVHLQAC